MEKCITQKNVMILFKILLVDDEDEEGEEFDDEEEDEDFMESDENEDVEDEQHQDKEGPSKKRKLD